MKTLVISLVFYLFLFSLTTSGYGQSTDPLALGQLLEKLKAEIMVPLDGDYRPLRMQKNEVQNYHWALGSTSEQLEIRYLILPDEGQALMDFPHLEASRLAMQTCSNEEHAAITARDLTEEERIDLYQADWGRLFIFPPKLTFGEYLHCKMVAVFKENRGMMVIFHLFDEPSPEIDNRLYTFRFID